MESHSWEEPGGTGAMAHPCEAKSSHTRPATAFPALFLHSSLRNEWDLSPSLNGKYQVIPGS